MEKKTREGRAIFEIGGDYELDDDVGLYLTL